MNISIATSKGAFMEGADLKWFVKNNFTKLLMQQRHEVESDGRLTQNF